MKKAYSKPQIVFESFELTKSIAAGCVYLSNTFGSPNSCTYTENGTTIFMSNCGYDNDDAYKDFCYHIPTDDGAIFNS